MKRFFLFIVALSIISCRTEHDAEDSAKDAADTTAFQEEIKTEEELETLEPEARNFALNWVEFITAQNEIEKLKGSKVGDVMNNSGAIAQIMQSLKTSLPDSLKSIPVEARLNVVNTKAQLLNQYSHKQEPDAEAISQTASELYTEFNNLKLQMNEIFRKSLEDFERELEEFERREQDSLRQDTLN